jgi:dihydrofolate reductase
MKISIIVAIAEDNVIGGKGKLLWHLADDLKRFKAITMGHHLLMGRSTYESIGRALPGRTSLVLSNNKNFKAEGCFTFQSFGEAVEFAKQRKEEELMIVGGGQIYRLALPIAARIYLTRVFRKYEGDVTFPEINEDEWKETLKESYLESDPPFEFRILERRL